MFRRLQICPVTRKTRHTSEVLTFIEQAVEEKLQREGY